MSEAVNDPEIVAGLQQGDRQAWEALCAKYSSRVWRYVTRLVDAGAAEDVFQETLLAAAGAGRRLDDETRLWAWLSRIAHTKSAEYWRRQYRNPQPHADGEPAIAAGDPPLAELLRAESIIAIRQLLAEMPAEQVALLTAKYLDEMSVKEIVDSLGGTIESVRSRLARARQEFRRRYERLPIARADEVATRTTNASPIRGELR